MIGYVRFGRSGETRKAWVTKAGFAAVATFPVLAFSAAPPSAATHLFRASVRDETYVFLPASDIRDENDEWAYARWAAATHESRGGPIRCVWDADGMVPLSASQKFDAAFLLREGDDAVDPSGEVAFSVASAPSGDDRRFSLRLAGPLPRAAGTTNPRNACFTNAWVLSREFLFERWWREIGDGNAADVRRQIRDLAASGRYKVEGGAEWEAEVRRFVEGTPDLWPALRVVNATGRRVVVSLLGDNRGVYFKPGQTQTVHLRSMPAGGRVSWMAREAEDGLCERDYESPREGEYAWNALGTGDAEEVLDGTLARRKPLPRIDISSILPEGAAPPEDLVVSVFYADSPDRPAQAKALPKAAGGVEIEVEPHRAVCRLNFAAPGWEPLTVVPKDAGSGFLTGSNGLCSADPPIVLKTPQMQAQARPWPDVEVKNESGHEIMLESNALEKGETKSVLSGMSKTLFVDKAWKGTFSAKDLDETVFVFATLTEADGGKALLSTNFPVRRGQGRVTVSVPPAPSGPEPVAASHAEFAERADISSHAEGAEFAGNSSHAEFAEGSKVSPSAPHDGGASRSGKPQRGADSRPPSTTTPRPGGGGGLPAAVASSNALPAPAAARTKPRESRRVPPLPSNDAMAKLATELKRYVNLVNGTSTQRESQDNLRVAQGNLEKLQVFTPLSQQSEGTEWFRAFRQSVAHFAECRGGCDSCRRLRRDTLGRGLDPKTEVFEALGGWKEPDQLAFRRGILERSGQKDRWPFSNPLVLKTRAVNWTKCIRYCLDEDDFPSQQQYLPKARRLWNMHIDAGEDEKYGTVLRQAYRHVELCGGCGDCASIRAAVIREATFEARRMALVRALLCDGKSFGDSAEKPLSAEELRTFARMMDEAASAQKGN